MRKIFLVSLFSLALVTAALSQSRDTLVVVYGKMLKAQDSTPISGTILYEKLPYYDDMGTSLVESDGVFELQLLLGETYNFSVTKQGYKKYQKEVSLDGNLNFDIYVTEDIVELRKLENLNFVTNSDQITSVSYGELDELAQWLNENPTIIIQLEGHTDFGGNQDAALRLSQARVESVRNYLIEKRVKKNRIFTKAFGGTQPIVTEGTREERAVNRRVEVRVIRR